ncbi:Thioredoxin reductase 1, cytoplasmic [Halotydeus destructor]|nr:Thioredoxin reductase 1, cytoplasmic [Halotydeus destructor]
MPPVNGHPSPSDLVDQGIGNNKVMIFSKTTCPFCKKVKDLFDSLNVSYHIVEIDELDNGPEVQSVLAEKTGRKTVPQVFIKGNFVGGCDDTIAAKDDGKLAELLRDHEYEYDLIIIGGGSGGLSASKTSARLGKKVAVFDFVPPSPHGSTWGLGGTCVNVGCIPKKLMHHAALIGGFIQDGNSFGWETSSGEELKNKETIKHNWDKMVENIQNHIRSLNFGYRVNLREEKVQYINAYAEFVDPHTVKGTDKKGKSKLYTAEKFIIATGERPRYPADCEGAELAISSDDLFSLPHHPGKTLVVGASYVALECAGFLVGLGYDTTVMVRSIFLRGFDQQIAEKIGHYMQEEGCKFLRPAVPVALERLEEGTPGRIKVTSKMMDSGELVTEEYNTVLFAIGRDPCTDKIGLENTGVIKNPKTGKIPVDDREQTNVEHIYAIGDILQNRLELTPVAVEAGMLLAKRLYEGSDVLTDYINVPTTVFTPLEYGAVGYSEEVAIEKFGEDNIDVYHQTFVPLEWTVPHRPIDACYGKLIVLRNENERVIGFHYLGPNGGEVAQFAGLAVKLKATKADFNALIGIHPVNAEVFTTMNVTKRSGLSADAKGC